MSSLERCAGVASKLVGHRGDDWSDLIVCVHLRYLSYITVFLPIVVAVISQRNV